MSNATRLIYFYQICHDIYIMFVGFFYKLVRVALYQVTIKWLDVRFPKRYFLNEMKVDMYTALIKSFKM